MLKNGCFFFLVFIVGSGQANYAKLIAKLRYLINNLVFKFYLFLK